MALENKDNNNNNNNINYNNNNIDEEDLQIQWSSFGQKQWFNKNSSQTMDLVREIVKFEVGVMRNNKNINNLEKVLIIVAIVIIVIFLL